MNFYGTTSLLMPFNYRVMDKEIVGPALTMQGRVMVAMVSQERRRVQVMQFTVQAIC